MRRVYIIFKKIRWFLPPIIICFMVGLFGAYYSLLYITLFVIFNVILSLSIGFSRYNEMIRRIFGVCLMHHLKYLRVVCREMKKEPHKYYISPYDKYRDVIRRIKDDEKISPICKECPQKCNVLSMIKTASELSKDDR